MVGVFSGYLLPHFWKPKTFWRVSNMGYISRISTSRKFDLNKEEEAGPRFLQHIGNSNEMQPWNTSITHSTVKGPWRTDLGKRYSSTNLFKNSTHSMSIVLMQKALSLRSTCLFSSSCHIQSFSNIYPITPFSKWVFNFNYS